MTAFDPARAAEELKWLQDHPWFEEKPASITEFLGADYLNIEKGVRAGLRQELIELFGEEVNGDRIALYRWAMFTGAIGIGKTTIASIVIPYMVHWVLCLKDPQDYYELLPGSRIAFMQMSTSGNQAKDVVFGDIKARIEHSPWFQDNYPFDPKFTNEIHFAKDIWILPGNSAETAFEGYNILGGILDEADSHKVTRDTDYAEQGFDTINSRVDSRFGDRGFLMVIGQMKKATGFAAKKYKEFLKDPEHSHAIRMTIWESLGWQRFLKSDGTRDSFWYDSKRKEIVPEQAAKMLGSDNLIEIPNVYRKNFENNPEKALRDLAGIPPEAGDSFISLTYKIDEAQTRWSERYDYLGSPVTTDPRRPQFADWFTCKTPLKRALHLDIAYSGDTGDAAGIALGHVSHLAEVEDELKPYIVFDCLIRVKAPPGQEIMLSELRRYIYDLRDELKFRISSVTFDGFQSTDTKQQMRKKRFKASYVSMDKSKLPYEDLRDALYEDRIEFPPYMTYINSGDTEQINIANRELRELEDTGRKIDHPLHGSKDVADAMAGVVYTLMGDRTYRRNVRSLNDKREEATADDLASMTTGTDGGYEVGGHYMPGLGSSGLRAPVPPRTPGNVVSFPTPPSLMPRRDRE